MIRPFTILSFLAFAGAGAWLYQVKHQVTTLDRELRDVVRQTEQLRERTSILRAEWALLNEPGRLREVAQRHLALETMQPTHFARANEIERRLPQAVAFAGAPSLFAPPPGQRAPQQPGVMLAAVQAPPQAAARPAQPAAAPAPAPSQQAPQAMAAAETPAPQALAAAVAAQRAAREAARPAAPAPQPRQPAPILAQPAPAPRPTVQPAIHVAPAPAPVPVTRVARTPEPAPLRQVASSGLGTGSALGGSALGGVSVLGVGSALARPALAPPVPVASASFSGGLAPPAR